MSQYLHKQIKPREKRKQEKIILKLEAKDDSQAPSFHRVYKCFNCIHKIQMVLAVGKIWNKKEVID